MSGFILVLQGKIQRLCVIKITEVEYISELHLETTTKFWIHDSIGNL